MAKKEPCLYIITDRHACGSRDLADVIASALAAVPAGAALVQLREKDLSGRALVALARRLVAVVESRGARLLVNDRIDVALAAGAHGVHLPEAGMDIATARTLAGPDFLIGVSTHSPEAAGAAAAQGADIIAFGPVWATPSKAGYGAPLDTAALAQAAARVRAHKAASHRSGALLFALGGITSPEHAALAFGAGACGIAAIRAFLSPADPGLAAKQMYDAFFSCH